MENKEHIQQHYIAYVLEHGRQPVSVFAFARHVGINEKGFYQHFNSFEGLEQDVWKDLFETTRIKVESQEVYMQYSVREKLLSFYYSWIEVLKNSRSFVVYTANKYPGRRLHTASLELYTFRSAFKEFAGELIREGRTTEEIIDRPYLSNRYADGFWMQALFVLNFWIKDQSKNFEQTDVAIEKAVNTSFDLLGRTPLDSIFDFAKFLYQSKN
jgi:AcrR family transcriptional regulator